MVAALLALALATPAPAQVALEARAGAAVGNHVPAHAGLETAPGLSLAGTVEYRPARAASIYVSYARAEFGCAEGLCAGRDVTIRTRGYGAGVRLHTPGLPWLRGGAVLYETEVATSTGVEAMEARPGFEVGAGVTLPIRGRVRLLPGLFLRTQPGEERTTLVGAEVGVQFAW